MTSQEANEKIKDNLVEMVKDDCSQEKFMALLLENETLIKETNQNVRF